jgi:periplasmic protein CpxP/Spy
MTIKSTSYAAALLGGLLLGSVALPVCAWAQTQTPAGSPSATTDKKAPARKSPSMAERVEQHIAKLRTELHITPAQQSEWDQFAQVMRENAKNMDHDIEQRGARFTSMSALENMQSYAQIAQQHAEDTQKLAATFQALYGSMSEDQKKNADAVFRVREDHRMHNEEHRMHSKG